MRMAAIDYNAHVLHVYKDPFSGAAQWHVGKYVTALVKPPANLNETSVYMTADTIGLKDSVFEQMRYLLNQWMYFNGREDPRAEIHTESYNLVKSRVEAVVKVIDAAVKRYHADINA
jgi:hypothetical protein